MPYRYPSGPQHGVTFILLILNPMTMTMVMREAIIMICLRMAFRNGINRFDLLPVLSQIIHTFHDTCMMVLVLVLLLLMLLV